MIRRLEKKDVEGMLGWMCDSEVNCFFQFDFASMTRERALEFVENSFTDETQHFAIVDDGDHYLGTISLKNISKRDRNAEYAIVTRKEAWGGGAAREATKEIIRYAFEELGLHRVYLNVLEENVRANQFYVKCGFVLEGTFKDHLYLQGEYKNLNWYAMTNSDD